MMKRETERERMRERCRESVDQTLRLARNNTTVGFLGKDAKQAAARTVGSASSASTQKGPYTRRLCLTALDCTSRRDWSSVLE